MPDSSLKQFLKGVLPVEIVDKLEAVLEVFNPDGTIETDLAITDDLTVGGDAAIGGDLAVTGTLASGAATVASAVITGAATVGTTLGVTGAATLSSTLAVDSTIASAAHSIAVPAVVATEALGLSVANATAALVGVQVQRSPVIKLSGNGWDTDDAVSRAVAFQVQNRPVAGATVIGNLAIQSSVGGAGFADKLVVSSEGNVTVTADIAAVGGFKNTVGPFVVTDMAAVGTDTATVFGFSAGSFVVPTDGSILAISVQLSEAAAGSDATFKIFKNGSAVSGTSVIISAAGGTSNYTTFAKDAKTFAAGDLLRVVYQTDAGTWSATNADAVATLTVEY